VAIHDAFSDAVVQTASIGLSHSGFYSEHLFDVKGTFYITFSLSGQHWPSDGSGFVEISILEQQFT
jgi:hypothetical protein